MLLSCDEEARGIAKSAFGFTLATVSDDTFYYDSIYRRRDFLICEVQYEQPLGLEDGVSTSVFCLLKIVDTAIHLDGKPGLPAEKVDNESSDDLLSSEGESCSAGAQPLPEQFFAPGQVRTKFFRPKKLPSSDFVARHERASWHGKELF